MSLVLNPKGFELIRNAVDSRLNRGSDAIVQKIKATVRVDTGRMKESTRNAGIVHQADKSISRVMIGGIKLRGVYREQEITRLVNYAQIVEIKFGDIRSQMGAIHQIARQEVLR